MQSSSYSSRETTPSYHDMNRFRLSDENGSLNKKKLVKFLHRFDVFGLLEYKTLLNRMPLDKDIKKQTNFQINKMLIYKLFFYFLIISLLIFIWIRIAS